jgi:N-acetylmuramoyl-L-alanine amidase
LQEKDVNLDIARRISAALRSARVIITRDGDFVAGLTYRTHIASAVGAQLFVSVHNNAQADTGSEHPGTETYYQHESESSRRLAGLTYEELRRVLDGFHVSWRSARDPGAKPRVNERGSDYYGVLRTSTVPAVITEGVYIDNPPEEALLRREDIRDDMALALSRAITRYLTTDDSGSGFVTKPLPRATGPRFRLPSSCTDPA